MMELALQHSGRREHKKQGTAKHNRQSAGADRVGCVMQQKGLLLPGRTVLQSLIRTSGRFVLPGVRGGCARKWVRRYLGSTRRASKPSCASRPSCDCSCPGSPGRPTHTTRSCCLGLVHMWRGAMPTHSLKEHLTGRGPCPDHAGQQGAHGAARNACPASQGRVAGCVANERLLQNPSHLVTVGPLLGVVATGAVKGCACIKNAHGSMHEVERQRPRIVPALPSNCPCITCACAEA